MSAGTELERSIRGGGVAVFPSDTVYGLACDPRNAAAVNRLYELKGRDPEKSAAVMFFDLDAALMALPELGERTREALARLMPGGVTALVPNPRHRYPLACRRDAETLGLRVVSVAALGAAGVAVLQSSANHAGEPDPLRLSDVPASIRAGADLVIDGGELHGVASTVLDLRRFEHGGIDAVSVIRPGVVGDAELAEALSGQFHFDPTTYLQLIREDVPEYDRFQQAVVELSGSNARAVLELGTGTGETARRLLVKHPAASLAGLDENQPMLARARQVLGPRQVTLHVGRLQQALPEGPFDLVVSALCVHHLDAMEKADLFKRVRRTLAPSGRFVLGDVVLPKEGGATGTPLTPGYDKPSTVAEQLAWLTEAGFEARLRWESDDLAVIVADCLG